MHLITFFKFVVFIYKRRVKKVIIGIFFYFYLPKREFIKNLNIQRWRIYIRKSIISSMNVSDRKELIKKIIQIFTYGIDVIKNAEN